MFYADLGRYRTGLPDTTKTIAIHARASWAKGLFDTKKPEKVATALAVVTGDVEGHVAFKAVGKIPLRKPDNDILGMAPSPGYLIFMEQDWTVP